MNVYDIFKKEATRLSNDHSLTLFYKKTDENGQKGDLLKYKVKKSDKSLCIYFKKNGDWDFYFRSENDGEKKGTLVAEFKDFGLYAKGSIKAETLPDAFRDIIARYQFDRESLGIDSQKELNFIKRKQNQVMER